MSIGNFSYLNQSFIKILGKDSLNFLNSLMTNDINKVSSSKGIYTLLLTPQGKFAFDMFITKCNDEGFLIEVNTDERENLIKKLSMYKLRSDIKIEKEDTLKVIAIWDENITKHYNLYNEGSIVFTDESTIMLDPRFYKLGVRIYSRNFVNENFLEGNYEQMRIELGIPEGNKDLINEKSFPLHFGMSKLNAIDYKKGCYVGQEVVSRTTYRGSVRKKIFKVSSNVELFQNQEFFNNSQKILICSAYLKKAIALVDIEENLKDFKVELSDNTILELENPDWDK